MSAKRRSGLCTSMSLTICLAVATTVATGCGQPGTAGTPTGLPATPVLTAPTATAQPTAVEPTLVPATAAVLPTATPVSKPLVPQPEASPTGELLSRIRFAPGATGARLIGDLQSNALDSYVLGATTGQVMTVAIQSPGQDVLLGVVGPDGQPLKRTAVGQPVWSGYLAATGDYVLQAEAAGSASPYTLTVSVLLSSTDARTRIQFDAGATAAVLRGRLEPSAADQYVLRASAGQWTEVSIATDGDGAILSLIGADGVPVLTSANQGTVWRGALPTTQDYALDVISAGSAASYDLVVTICSRIQFEPGGTSARVTGWVQKGFQGCHVLRALGGQTMEVVIESPGEDVLLSVVGADGVPLKRYVDGQPFWMGQLPEGQDYFLQPFGGGSDSQYTLTVKVHPLPVENPIRIQFAPGTTQATAKEHLDRGESDRYVLRAQQGQWMDLTAWPQGKVELTVAGSDGSYWGLGAGSSSLTIQELPATQDYIVNVSTSLADSAPLDYTLVVTVVWP